MLPEPFVTLTDASDMTLTVTAFDFAGEKHWIVNVTDPAVDTVTGLVLTDVQALALAAALKVSVTGGAV